MQKAIVVLLAALVGLFGFQVVQNHRLAAAPEFGTAYQAVLLVGGQVYYGRLENASGQFPVLRDVYYVSSQLNPDTHQAQSVLVRRGRELHGPEYMVLNRRNIMFIEPVSPDSAVAKFIDAQKK